VFKLADELIMSDIEPGPANIGIAIGENEISSFTMASSSTLLLMALPFLKLPSSML
jgi:hypothetical protein